MQSSVGHTQSSMLSSCPHTHRQSTPTTTTTTTISNRSIHSLHNSMKRKFSLVPLPLLHPLLRLLRLNDLIFMFVLFICCYCSIERERERIRLTFSMIVSFGDWTMVTRTYQICTASNRTHTHTQRRSHDHRKAPKQTCQSVVDVCGCMQFNFGCR